MRPHEMRVILVNKTPLDLYFYYKGMPGFILRVSANRHQRPDLRTAGYYSYFVPHFKSMSIPLDRGWKRFNGIKFDQSAIRDHYLVTEETSDETTGEYWIRIDIAQN